MSDDRHTASSFADDDLNAAASPAANAPAPSQRETLLHKIQRNAPRIRTLNLISIVLAVILAVVALGLDKKAFETDERVAKVNEAYITSYQATYDLRTASDYLTNQSHMFTITGNKQYLDNYMEELTATDRRGNAVTQLKGISRDEEVNRALDDALAYSEKLVELELYAMRLTADRYSKTGLPAELEAVTLTKEDASLTILEKGDRAEAIVLGKEYAQYKTQMSENADVCSQKLLAELSAETEANDRTMQSLLDTLHIIVIALVVIILFIIANTALLILMPVSSYAERVKENEPLDPVGAKELRYLADAYNRMHAQVAKQTLQLRRDAERDPLTGLYNRGVYDTIIESEPDNMALLLVDVDNFKSFNDQYGHDKGDKVLKHVAEALLHAFRSTDYVCRIGGDEFAVIITHVTPDLRGIIVEKLHTIADKLQNADDKLPAITLSVGIAFSDKLPPSGRIYPAADNALYHAKRCGRNGFAFYGEGEDGAPT